MGLGIVGDMILQKNFKKHKNQDARRYGMKKVWVFNITAKVISITPIDGKEALEQIVEMEAAYNTCGLKHIHLTVPSPSDKSAIKK